MDSVVLGAGATPQYTLAILNVKILAHFTRLVARPLYGLVLDGISFFRIEDNYFNDNTNGTRLLASGSRDNDQLNNNFNFNGVGIFAYFDNNGYKFKGNCFENTTSKDFRLNGQSPNLGKINPNQGDASIGASNQFTFSTSPRGITITTSETFNYHIKSGTLLASRYVPPSYPGNLFDAANAVNCGSSNALIANEANRLASTSLEEKILQLREARISALQEVDRNKGESQALQAAASKILSDVLTELDVLNKQLILEKGQEYHKDTNELLYI